MRLFPRGGDQAAGIGEFWEWWAKTRPELDMLVEEGDIGAINDKLAPAVAAVHPSLVWEISPGRDADQALVVTSAGDPELRSLAHRLALAAPPADARWEYHPSRQANPAAMELKIDVAGRELAFDRLVLGLRVPPGNPRVDVTIYHPIFPDLGDETRMEASILALDWILGEDDVARWIGEIIAATAEPLDAVPAIHLPAVVADVATDYAEPQWVLLEGQTQSGNLLTATARHPLRPVDHPLFDQHISIALPYRSSDANGLPTSDSVTALESFENHLTETLTRTPEEAILAAHVTADGARTFHIYADPTTDTAIRTKSLIPTWQQGRPRMDVTDDPGWLSISPFLT
ncbi:MAG TPA: DUF695 domain-containing protein [Thermopolyspora sp.]